MPFATAHDGTRLSFEEIGSSGEPLLLISGTALDRHGWDSATGELTDSHRVIRYDHRGTGASDSHLPEGWTTRDFAADAASVIQASGHPRVHVYGHSMGGRVAQWLAADHPELVAALVLGGTSVGEAHGAPRPAAATEALLVNDPTAMRRMFYPDDWIAENPEAAAAVFPVAHTPEALARHLAAAMGHDGWDALPRISSPTLLVHGGDDTMTVPENAHIIAEHVPGAEVLVIDGARHAYWIGRPYAHREVMAFLVRHPCR